MNRVRLAGFLEIFLVGVAPAVTAQGVDTILVGNAALDAARLQTGTYAMESFQRAGGTDTPISTTTQTITRARQGNLDVYVIHTTHVPVEGDTTIGVIVVRARDLALLHHRVKAQGDSAAVAVSDGHLTGWVVLPNEPTRLIDQRLERAVFPVEGQIPWLFPLLPLAEGYTATIPHYSQWEGGEDWDTIHVVGTERVTRDGSAFDCWKVDGGELFPGYSVTYWVDKSTRRVVQGVAAGSEGGPEYWSQMRGP